MPLNWDLFAGLPDSADANFEQLCRAIVRRHYGHYGSFAALAAQPGVEFHLRLHTVCSLGMSGRWYGWQCRWYDLPGGRALGAARRNKISEALRKTATALPDLTDWVLWTRRPLTAGDQRWFNSLATHMRLHQWTTAEVEDHLSGPAEILRSTYFGELIIRPALAAGLHQVSVAPIRTRWQPETHQVVDAERALRRMLGEAASWEEFARVSGLLRAAAATLGIEGVDLTDLAADAVGDLTAFLMTTGTALEEAHTALGRGDLDLLRNELERRPRVLGSKLLTLPRQLRALRHRAALTTTNAIADCRLAVRLLEEVESLLGKRLVGVLADAGCGKTQLAAQLSAPMDTRPAGIFLRGKALAAGQSLDQFASGVVIEGTPVRSMDALLEAVDAAGQRAGRRLPIVIDGLNEAEDPRDWKPLLASLRETLRRFPYVLVVCTARSAFCDQSLPVEIDLLELPGFGRDRNEAIGNYFAHYRIDPADAELPMGLLDHPLTLRIFCEVTNPTRERTVGVNAMPGSLSTLFDMYLKRASERLVELAPRTSRYYEHDVRVALDEVAMALWAEHSRSLDLAGLRQRIGDAGRPWNESLVCALEQEGVLLREPGEPPHGSRVSAAYDALSGHLIASTLLANKGRDGFERWLQTPETRSAFSGDTPDRHPLAEDVFAALVGLVPRRHHRQQLWQLLEPPLRDDALDAAAHLDGAYLDAATVDELLRLVARRSKRSWALLDRLLQTRGSPDHPLNADFLDAALRPMTIAARDVHWSEWIRGHDEELLANLVRRGKRWRDHPVNRSQSDRLRARWIMWALTSTVRELRDQATNALYWFGRGDCAALFDLALDSLTLNDPYIPERMLAASYGVVMAHQAPDAKFTAALQDFLVGLRDAFVGPAANHPTDHWLARVYIQGIGELASCYCPDALPAGFLVDGSVPFASGQTPTPIGGDDPRTSEMNRALSIDFEDSTLDRLFLGNHDYSSTKDRRANAAAHLRGAAWSFGWREGGLGALDRQLVGFQAPYRRLHTERYGKKYGWIGYYNYAGILEDGRQRPAEDRRSHVDIDPSFPEPPRQSPLGLSPWVLPTPTDDRLWIRSGAIEVPDSLLYRADIEMQPGPWIAVYGYLTADQQVPGRRVVGQLTTLLVPTGQVSAVARLLASVEDPRSLRLPALPPDHYVFAGEIPWSPQFARMPVDSKPTDLYSQETEIKGRQISVEILAHSYEWESYHSPLNRAGGALVPSLAFSSRFDLRGVSQSFDQFLPDGTVAAVSLSAPPGFQGHLLYLREDLVHDYAGGRSLVCYLWGDRQIWPPRYPPPDWLVELAEEGADVWRKVVRMEELSSLFASKGPRRRS